MKTYRFECYDTEAKSTVTMEFDTDVDTWTGFDGPMYRFFEFLKGNGFVFHHEAQIGVLDSNGEFIGADE